jgi:hypothetical protein
LAFSRREKRNGRLEACAMDGAHCQANCSLVEKLWEENLQRLFAGFASFRHSAKRGIAPPNFIHCLRRMLRDLRFGKFGQSAQRYAIK